MRLKQLLENVKTKDIIGDTNVEISDVCYNSSKVENGSLFVAISGFKTDGHKYIADAVENGAAAIVAEKYTENINAVQIIVENSRIAEAQISAAFFRHPSKQFKLIGITGTNGKTTVTYLVKHILEHCGFKTGLIGTNQNMISDEVIETGRTTPDAFELQELFSKMVKKGVSHVVMEVSSHALELSRVHGCKFSVGAFTNLTQDHLDFHKTMDNYAAAKAKLFSESECAVINTKDDYGRKMVKNAPCKVLTYGADDAALAPKNVRLLQNGVSFDTCETEFCVKIPGEFSVYNALCAIGICKELGIELSKIAEALKSAAGVKGRAEVVDTGKCDYTVMIDYAHTPDGLENILNTVRGFAKGRVVALFGCGGDRDSGKREKMGYIAGKLADFCIVTSDNPRTEEPMKIISMIEEGVRAANAEYTVIEKRRDAIKYALDNAKSGDVIVLAGKGHETYQILNEGTIHFDEREVVRDILFGGR